ncbi:MAG: hypothetical protein EHM68_09295 [Lysobacterales bacterium]|nr:MAG: hypothetical protein EHM68_09295 [Xanthomonadales bacterium]
MSPHRWTRRSTRRCRITWSGARQARRRNKKGAGCRIILPRVLQRTSFSADNQVHWERLAPRTRAWGLSLRWFASIEDARSTIDDRQHHYHQVRSHRSTGRKPPARVTTRSRII